MGNRALFSGDAVARRQAPETDAVNLAGGRAYARSDEEALCQYVLTGTFNGTFYATAEDHLTTVLTMTEKVDTIFLAKLAVYGREKAFMKDTPAFLLAVLAKRDIDMLSVVFPRVIDNAKMLRNFVQFVRSGVTGRKSLGSRPKALIKTWIDSKTEEQLFRQSTGNQPSLADIVKMVHPKPASKERMAFYAWLIGKPAELGFLPDIVQTFEAYKKDRTLPLPDIPFEMLTAMELTPKEWATIAQRATWTQTRMNLNTFKRHDVFNDPKIVLQLAERLENPELVRKAKAFPYQLLAAYLNAAEAPMPIRIALQKALEIATENVPVLPVQTFVFPDVSGSMQSSVTGERKGSTSKVRCIDVAALVAAGFMRANPFTRVMPFAEDVVDVQINPLDSIMTNAEKLAGVGGGGTNCSAPLTQLNKENAKGDLCIFVSDSESWMDTSDPWSHRGTETMVQWEIFKRRNPQAKLVCIDLQPGGTTQAKERSDILNIGGFSDQVFERIADFVNDKTGASLQATVQAVELTPPLPRQASSLETDSVSVEIETERYAAGVDGREPCA